MADRPLPALDRDNTPFWTGGAGGELLIEQCSQCNYWVHPPTGFCPECESRDVHPRPVTGLARVAAFTINKQQWLPSLPVPYVVALLELDEQPDVRLVTNIVDCKPEDVRIGMPVKVRFEQADDVWVPLFTAVEADPA